MSVITRGYPSFSTRNGHSSTINGHSSTINRRFSLSTSNLRTFWKEGEFKLVASQQSRLAHDHQMRLRQDVLCQVQPCGNYIFFLEAKSQWFLHINYIRFTWRFLKLGPLKKPFIDAFSIHNHPAIREPQRRHSSQRLFHLL